MLSVDIYSTYTNNAEEPQKMLLPQACLLSSIFCRLSLLSKVKTFKHTHALYGHIFNLY